MEIEQINPATNDVRQVIDSWLERCSATIYHTTDWNLIVQDVFGTVCKYFLAYYQGNLVGVLPCHFVKSDRYVTICYSPPRIYEVTYGGPVAIGAESPQISESLVRAAAHSGIGVFIDIFNSPQNTDWAVLTGWKRVTAYESAYVNLGLSLDDIWRFSLNGKRRNMIRKAEKAGVQVRHLGLEGLDQYYDLVQETMGRAGLHAKPKIYYAKILRAFGARDQARLYLAFHNGAALTGGIFLRHQNMCYYWVGATASNSENLGQGELLQWQVIQWAKEAGCEWYDLVGIERDRLPHIARFKLGFTDHIVSFHHVSYATIASRVLRRVKHTLWKNH